MQNRMPGTCQAGSLKSAPACAFPSTGAECSAGSRFQQKRFCILTPGMKALFLAERSHVLASDKAHSPDIRFIREMNFSVFSAKSPGKLSRR